MKECRTCLKEKPKERFYFNKISGSIFADCMECHRRKMRSKYLKRRLRKDEANDRPKTV
jgi:hypothetical protein